MRSGTGATGGAVPKRSVVETGSDKAIGRRRCICVKHQRGLSLETEKYLFTGIA